MLSRIVIAVILISISVSVSISRGATALEAPIQTAQKKPLNQSLNVVLFSPNNNDQGFWGDVHSFARASASDLGIQFRIIYNPLTNWFGYLDIVENYLKSANKPDAFLAVSFRRRTKKLLELSVEYDVPVILINNGLPHDSRREIGPPRQNYKTYLGHISANDFNMSYLLAKELLKQARTKNKLQSINIVGIAGSRDAPESYSRNRGLIAATREDDNSQVLQIIYAQWDGALAYRKSKQLIQRHQQLDIIWCASDLMAISAQRAIEESNKNILIGGIDWTADALRAVKSGQLAATAGGHFTDGGFALVMLYDYFHGQDFAKAMALTSRSASGVIHQGNIDEYYDWLTKKDWQAIDFTKYSRVFHPENTSYDFSFDNLFD